MLDKRTRGEEDRERIAVVVEVNACGIWLKRVVGKTIVPGLGSDLSQFDLPQLEQFAGNDICLSIRRFNAKLKVHATIVVQDRRISPVSYLGKDPFFHNCWDHLLTAYRWALNKS